ncbi:MAG: transcription factor S [Desulfurococcaceae archaeon]
MVKFCPRCGGLLKPFKGDGKSLLVCNRCGYKAEASEDAKIKVSSKIEHSVKEKTIVVESGLNASNLPITRDVTCKKCGSHEAYYWVVQTRAADEPSTRFYKCTKCGYVWREYE